MVEDSNRQEDQKCQQRFGKVLGNTLQEEQLPSAFSRFSCFLPVCLTVAFYFINFCTLFSYNMFVNDDVLFTKYLHLNGCTDLLLFMKLPERSVFCSVYTMYLKGVHSCFWIISLLEAKVLASC